MVLTIRKENYKAGDVIFKEGSHGVAVYVLSSGRVEISKIVQDNKIAIEILAPGDMFGEMSFIDRAPRSATATALDDTVLELVDKDFLDREFNQIASDFREILTTLVKRLRKTTQSLVTVPRRRDERVGAKIRINFKTANDFFKAFITNLGTGGLFIKTTYKTVDSLPVGSILSLEFNLPGINNTIKTKGKVIWTRSQDMVDEKRPPGMGVQFIETRHEDSELLRKYITKFRSS